MRLASQDQLKRVQSASGMLYQLKQLAANQTMLTRLISATAAGRPRDPAFPELVGKFKGLLRTQVQEHWANGRPSAGSREQVPALMAELFCRFVRTARRRARLWAPAGARNFL